MALPVPHHRFTVAEYHQMAETGILKREDRVELINGEVIEMSAVSPETLPQACVEQPGYLSVG